MENQGWGKELQGHPNGMGGSEEIEELRLHLPLLSQILLSGLSKRIIFEQRVSYFQRTENHASRCLPLLIITN